MNPEVGRTQSPALRAVALVALLWLTVLYVFNFNHYRDEYIDDAWSLSWADQWVNHGNPYDTIFGEGTDNGTVYFARGYARLYGTLLNWLGWTRANAYLISTILVLAGAAFWAGALRRAGWSRSAVLAAMVALVGLEAFFWLAQKARVDALTYALIAAAVYAYAAERPLIAGVLVGLAVENHFMGAIAGVYLFGWEIGNWQLSGATLRAHVRQRLPVALRLGLGLALGAAYYLALHGAALAGLAGVAGSQLGGNAFLDYFFFTRFSWRRWPEAVLILTGFGVAFGWPPMRSAANRRWSLLAVLVVGSSLLLQRANQHYVVYFFPAVVFLLVRIADEARRLSLFLALLLLYTVPLFGALRWMQRGYDHVAAQNQLARAIATVEAQRPGLSPDTLILANPDAWFLLRERNYREHHFPTRRPGNAALLPATLLLVENDRYRTIDLYAGDRELLAREYRCTTELEYNDYRGQPIRLQLCEREGGSQ